MNKIHISLGMSFAVIAMGFSSNAFATVIQTWTIAEGGNGHAYELVELPSFISWTDARDQAAMRTYLGSPGHLLTLTSAAEDNFVLSRFGASIGDPNTNVPGIYAWIGLSDSASEGNYQWVTGEPFSFSNWAPPEPNNLGNQDYVHVWRRKFTGTAVDPNGTVLWSWNDDYNTPTTTAAYRGYFVEYSGPFTQAVPEPNSLVVWCVLSLAGVSLQRSGRTRKQSCIRDVYTL